MTEAQIEYVATHDERERCTRIVRQYAADIAPSLDEPERSAFLLVFEALVAILNAEAPS